MEIGIPKHAAGFTVWVCRRDYSVIHGVAPLNLLKLQALSPSAWTNSE